MNNSNKCHKCGLVNAASDLACRRCGRILGLPVRESLIAQKTKSPRFLVLLPFLLLALGFWYWSAEIRKSATNAMNVDKQEWHQLTMDPKVSYKDPLPSPTVYDPSKDPRLKAANEELKKQLEESQKMSRVR